MKASGNQTLPRARASELIVKELPDEVLVYDLQRQKAHCLNQTSALVWKRCDGRTTVKEMARALENEFATPVGEDVVWLALTQLHRLHLLQETNAPFAAMKVTRRDLLGKYLPAALALPLILSIPAPTAAQAASNPCAAPNNRPNGCPCTIGPDCQSGCCIIAPVGGGGTCAAFCP